MIQREATATDDGLGGLSWVLGKTSSLQGGTPGEVALLHPWGFSRQDQPDPVLVTALQAIGWETPEVPSHHRSVML